MKSLGWGFWAVVNKWWLYLSYCCGVYVLVLASRCASQHHIWPGEDNKRDRGEGGMVGDRKSKDTGKLGDRVASSCIFTTATRITIMTTTMITSSIKAW